MQTLVNPILPVPLPMRLSYSGISSTEDRMASKKLTIKMGANTIGVEITSTESQCVDCVRKLVESCLMPPSSFHPDDRAELGPYLDLLPHIVDDEQAS